VPNRRKEAVFKSLSKLYNSIKKTVKEFTALPLILINTSSSSSAISIKATGIRRMILPTMKIII